MRPLSLDPPFDTSLAKKEGKRAYLHSCKEPISLWAIYLAKDVKSTIKTRLGKLVPVGRCSVSHQFTLDEFQRKLH